MSKAAIDKLIKANQKDDPAQRPKKDDPPQRPKKVVIIKPPPGNQTSSNVPRNNT